MKPTIGKVLRTDYRCFQFAVNVPFEQRDMFDDVEQISKRVDRYMRNRDPNSYIIQLIDRTVMLEFRKLDDARMFVLAFSDVVETHGVKFD